LSNFYTGVSGITPLSPALTVASRSGDMALSVYENGKYNIYSLDSSKLGAGSLPSTLAPNHPALLPPQDRPPRG
jgi:hypothetical protein